jgi:hypothetical protein
MWEQHIRNYNTSQVGKLEGKYRMQWNLSLINIKEQALLFMWKSLYTYLWLAGIKLCVEVSECRVLKWTE